MTTAGFLWAGFVRDWKVKGSKLAGSWEIWCLDPGSKNSGSGAFFPSASGDNGRGKLNSHYRDANVSEIHIPGKIC